MLLQNLKSLIDITLLHNITSQLWHMVCLLQNSTASLSDVFEIVYNTLCSLYGLRTNNEHDLAADLQSAIENRFHTTANMCLPLFAFILTQKGITFYSMANNDLKNKIYQNSLKGAYDYMKETQVDVANYFQQFVLSFNQFLTISLSNTSHDIGFIYNIDFQHSNSLFCEISKRVLEMPCSEASVERLFSHMCHIY